MKICLKKDLEPLRAEALARLDNEMNTRIHHLISSPVAALRAQKAREAEQLRAGGVVGPLLTAESHATGISPEALAEAVLAKAAAAAGTLAALEVERQAIQLAIRTATTPAGIEDALPS